MKWQKLGRIVDPENAADWMVTHAALPFATPLAGTRVRVYCSGRDREGRAQIGYVETDLRDPVGSAVISKTPILTVGPLGAFDDRGVLSASAVVHEGRQFMYFTGVMLGKTVPFYYNIGLATSEAAALNYAKLSLAPIIDRNPTDPFLTASPFVMRDRGFWRMWYISGQRWELENGAPKHFYHVRYAESDDGIFWRRDGRVCVDFKPGEYAIARPSVIRDDAIYRMWYCFRGERYRIGYAESPDGIDWTRKDEEAGIDVSPDGWDSEMVCYPHVFDHAGVRYMLYNGNSYGRTGFGLARLVR